MSLTNWVRNSTIPKEHGATKGQRDYAQHKLFLPIDHPLVVRPSWSHLSLHGLQKVTNADMEAWNEANLVFT